MTIMCWINTDSNNIYHYCDYIGLQESSNFIKKEGTLLSYFSLYDSSSVVSIFVNFFLGLLSKWIGEGVSSNS